MTDTFSDPNADPADDATRLPPDGDSETMALLRAFLLPILEAAQGWDDLDARLRARGFAPAFRRGRLVIVDDTGRPVCTGAGLGAPLRLLVTRLGRPRVRADRTGRAGALFRTHGTQAAMR